MKRSYSSLISSSSLKRSKAEDSNDSDQLTSTALNFFLEQSKNLFLNHLRIPPIIFKHQLYSLKPNDRTLIDCQLQDMFNQNKIRFFHSDHGVMLMFTRDYQFLIERQLSESNMSSLAIEKDRLKQRYIEEFLPKYIRLSIDREQLENQYQFNSNDIQLLIQSSLLQIKDTDQYWITIPNLSQFISCLKKGRRTLLHLLARRTYREIPIDEFRQRDTKKTCLMGFDYHIHDLLGTNLAHLIDTPTGLVIKIGSEKF